MRALSLSASHTFPLPSTATPTGLSNCPFSEPLLPQVVRNVPHLDGTQTPSVPGFCRLQSFTKPRQAFRCAACIFRQAVFSAFAPVQALFVSTSARQFLMSCLQSLGQWLGFAAIPIP